MSMKFVFIFVIACISYFSVNAQYTLNGSAVQNDCHCYTLTQNVGNQHGSVWNNNKIDLNQSFDFTFQVFLGCGDFNGADGIAFVLQPISTSVGSAGGGMGYQGITPAVAVTLDTYQNASPDNDPSYDHVAIQLNGNLDHSSSSTLTPPTPISASSDDVEDCQNHLLRIVWNSSTKNLAVFIDNQPRVNATKDLVNTLFGGNSLVYWGFTGATGGLYNLQKFCTTLSPSFHFSPSQKKCAGEPITFYDSTIAFTPTIKRYWNFGDGSPIDSVNTNPTHIYNTAGFYTVVFRVVTPDGCSASFPKTVEIGSKPIADFTITDSCLSNSISFTDASTVAGSVIIDNWFWDVDNAGQVFISNNPSTTYSTSGIKNIKFVVKTNFGCESDTLFKPINIYDSPVNDFDANDSVCLGSPLYISDLSTSLFGNVNYWNWTFSDSVNAATTQNPVHIFTVPGLNYITLTTSTVGTNACTSNSITKPVYVATIPEIAFQLRDTCKFSPVLFTAAETSTNIGIQNWFWDFGDGTQQQGMPVTHTYSTNGQYSVGLYAISTEGCKSRLMVEPIIIYGTEAFAGNDTLIAFNQPLQLNATGGITYEWSPSFGLSATDISNPVAVLNRDMTYYLKASTPSGCESKDTIHITTYQGPEIYSPNAFTPNGDGLNDVLSPLIVGFQSIDYFNIFNRYGQLVYSYKSSTRGWDGKFNGSIQPTGTFVWIASGIDYTGKKIVKKGTVLLIR